MDKNQKGPFKSVTHKGSTVNIYHTPSKKNGKKYDSYTLIYTRAGATIRKSIANQKKALETAKKIAEQLSEGTAHVVALTPENVADYTAALKILRKFPSVPLASVCQQYAEAMDRLEVHGSTIMDAVLTHLAEKQKSAPSEIKVSALLDEYLAAKEEEHLSTYYLKDLRRKLIRFAASFPCSISSIKSGDIKKWITKQGSGRNARNLHTSVSSFFSYAREHNYLPANDRHAVEQVSKVKEDEAPIGIYTPAELVKILAHTPEEMIPSIAIAAFAGLRSAELFRLDWSEIKLEQGHIEVPAQKAKTASRRLIEDLPPCLHQWLSPRQKKIGRVTPNFQNLDNLTRKYAKICEKAGVKTQRNGFRHSFASYRMAAVKSADQVALEMGNSPKKLFSNYRALVTEAQATEWFGITPSKVKKSKPPEKKDSTPSRQKKGE